MNLRTEYQSEKQKILLIDKTASEFGRVLKAKLEQYDNEVFVSPKLPQNIAAFDICFMVNEMGRTLDLVSNFHKKRFIFIFIDEPKKAEGFSRQIHKMQKPLLKVIAINGSPTVPAADLDKILWFSLTQSHEIYLGFHYRRQPKPVIQAPPPPRRRKRRILRWRTVFIGVPLILFILHILFIPPLLLGTYYVYRQAQALQAQDLETVLADNQKSEDALDQAKQLYTFARPVLLVFSVAFMPDNVFQIDESANNVLQESVPLIRTGQAYVSLFMKKDKSPDEQQLLLNQQKSLEDSADALHQDLAFLYQKIPDWNDYLRKTKEQMRSAVAVLDGIKRIIPHLNQIFAMNAQKKYLLLFANNMELRPGGGFIGSFGVANVQNYGLQDLQVYDVYDADGQLKAHIEPPAPIRKYLNQPHWFLRDSGFSPDFPTNYEQAKFFLDREMGFRDFSGGILVTTTAIQDILEAMGNIYVPDFNEIVNKDNFYLKAQLYAEKNFFPGSVQKKHFLSAVMNQILLQLEDASYPKLVQMIDRALNEKQVVMYFDDPDIQKAVDTQYWAGRTIAPSCPAGKSNCTIDYLMPIDANLGVNKANFFVNRSVGPDVQVDTSGRIRNRFSMEMRNDSLNYAFPGGPYKNYMQLALPQGAIIKSITKNGTQIDGYDETNDLHKTVGFYMEIAAQTTAHVEVVYELPNRISQGQGIYQLIVQKQIGSSNYDFRFSLAMPRNIYITNQNFSPLVKDNGIHYNTTIKADKIFYIELLKE